MYFYRAFEMSIASEIRLDMLNETTPFISAEVSVIRETADYLKKFKAENQGSIQVTETSEGEFWFFCREHVTAFNVSDRVSFIIESGSKISVVSDDSSAADGLLAVFILGSCMGAVIHQRGRLPIHGSCVARDGKSLIIMGDSGAGKSTVAREFLRHGWKLVTDDVTVVDFAEGRPQAVPSYPSQKLWEDAVDHYGIDESSLTPLFQEERKEKFHVAVEDLFCSARTDLAYAVWLIAGPEDCSLETVSVEGFPVVDRFMRNIYRLYLREKKSRNAVFQQCADISEHIRMFETVRPAGKDCAGEIYEEVVSMISER